MLTGRLTAALVFATLFANPLAPRPASAQSLTSGGLSATILGERGQPIRDVSVTVERSGIAVRTLITDRAGTVSLPVLAPGVYSVLAEQIGFQPVRMREVHVVAGGSTRVSITLIRKPPPITTVAEAPSNEVITGTAGSSVLNAQQLLRFDRRHDVTGPLDGLSRADVTRDGRDGLASANGLPPVYSGLIVDGVREAFLRHPGVASEPITAPAFAPDAIDQLQVLAAPNDLEWPPSLGMSLGAQTMRGPDRTVFAPWLDVSAAKLGGRSADNPGDSSATSFRGGVRLGGPIKGDTGSWAIHADYQRLQLPQASPFRIGQAGSDSGDVTSAVISAGNAAHQDLGRWLNPTVRRWSGGSANARLDWRFGANTLAGVRVAGASWTEDNVTLGDDLVNGAGNHLDSHDVSGAAFLTIGGTQWTSDTRVGFHTSKRDWSAPALPYTGIVGDGFALGTAFELPGVFSENGVGLYEAVTVRAGSHTLKGGAAIEQRVTNYDWVPGSSGRYLFGGVNSFRALQGAYYQTFHSSPAPDITISDLGLYLQDRWQATPTLQLFAGVRQEREHVPSDAISSDAAWGMASGLRNELAPQDTAKGARFYPQGGISWDASGTGRTVVRASFAMVPGRYDVAALAEAAEFDGDVTVRRATGTVGWPGASSTTGQSVGQAITMFNAAVRKPRSYAADVSLEQRLDDHTTLSLGGSYRHADYLLRRQDLNLVAGPVSTAADGRPIFGTLDQFGGLIVPAVGSNRRFAEFDAVYGLTSTGYNDYYEANLRLERSLARGLRALVSYTWSRTTDNLPGMLSGDPADRLSPFPTGLNGAVWENGRSDFDVPNRAAATLSYTASSSRAWMIAGRFRYRSGFPFTPGFRSGVDANGDGSGNNDPAFVGANITGMSALEGNHSCLSSQNNAIATRNSCRDPGMYSFDVSLAVPLVKHPDWSLNLTLDGFNLVSSGDGVFDHAAVLVNPAGSISTDANGRIVLPLIANPDFGQLLSRRGNSRQLRAGVRVEY